MVHTLADKNINVLIGPYRSGKTRKLLADLVSTCTSDGAVRLGSQLVVPSSRYRKLAQRLLSEQLRESDSKGLLGLQVDNFYNLCGQILKKAGITYRLIPDSVRPAIVARALNHLVANDQLTNLAPLADFKGTCGSILELIDEFQRAGLSPDDVLAKLRLSSSTSTKHFELAKVYKQYWAELDAIDFIDNRRLAFSCREHLSSRKDSSKIYAYVGVDGFDRFNKLQLDVLRELAPFCEKLSICFDYVKDIENSHLRQEYVWKQSSFDDLINRFPDANLSWFDLGEDEALEIGCFKAVDRYLELEEIARKIKADLVGGKAKAEDILLVVPSMRRYRSAIEAAFDDAQIPYFVDDAVPLSTVPIIQFIFKLLCLPKSDFARAEVIGTINNQHFNKKSFQELHDNRILLDDLSLEANLIGSIAQWTNLKIDTSLKSVLQEFLDVLVPPDGENTLTDYVSWVEDVMAKCVRQADLEEYEDPLKVWIEDRALFELRNCLGGLVQEGIVLNGDQSGMEMDFETFIYHLEHAVEQSNFRSVPSYEDPVNICSVDLAPNRKFAKIYMAGLVEGEFPRRTKARGFVSFDEISLWYSYGVLIDNPRLHPAFEYGLFQSLLKRAKQNITLSLPMWDMEGDEVLPSFFISSGELKLTIDEMAPYKMSSIKPYSIKDLVSGGLALGSDTEVFKEYPSPEVDDLISSMADQKAMLLARLQGISSNYNGSLEEQFALGTLNLAMPTYWSASRLNEYGKCPFRYWVGRVLNIEVHEEPSVEVDTRLLGEAYHLALENFYARLIEEKILSLNADRKKVEEIYKQTVEEAITWLEENSRVKENQFWRFIRQEIEFRLKRFFENELERESKAKEVFYAEQVEAEFGMETKTSAPPLVISDGKEEIKIRGKIDRIDRGANNSDIRIVDYKAGSSYISGREAIEGRNLQMPIYLLAAESCSSSKSYAKSVEGVYLSVSSGKPIGRIDLRDPEKKRAYVDATKEHVLNYVKSIKRGHFKVEPNGNTVCNSCQHKLICRISEMKKG